MSIAVLSEVYQETRRLAIAGSGLASGDFRLQKLVPPLERAGEKAPVFAKVAAAINRVVESDAKSASGALLELITLVTAILYTQGKTGAAGRLKPIETSGFGMPSAESSARVLKPLIEALTTTGSGRLEVITEAFGRGAFKDLRLVKPALAAIDDVYGDIGDFVAKNILPTYGKTILPDLRASFDVKGKSNHARRLRLMHQLDAEGTHDLVEAALESGSKEMKVAAIWCLKGSKGHLSFLLEQTRAKAKDVRQAAFSVMARFTDNEVIDSLIKALTGGDIDLVAGPVSQNRSPQLLKVLLEEGQMQLDALVTSKDKAQQKKALPRLYQLLGAFVSRDDKQSGQFLIRCFNHRTAIEKLKGTTCDGEAINLRVAALMVRSNSKTTQKALVDAHETLPPNALGWALIAAARTRKPKEVYDLFSPYYLAVVKKKRGRDPVKEKQDVVRGTLCEIAGGHLQRYGRYDFDDELQLDESEFAEITSNVKIDTAWLDAAVRAEDLTTVSFLAKPRHKGAITFLAGTLDGLLAESGDQDRHLADVIETMIRMQHPRTVDYFLKALQKSGKRTRRYYYDWRLAGLIPELPKRAAPKIAELLPSLDEKTVDEVIPYLEELKAK